MKMLQLHGLKNPKCLFIEVGLNQHSGFRLMDMDGVGYCTVAAENDKHSKVESLYEIVSFG